MFILPDHSDLHLSVTHDVRHNENNPCRVVTSSVHPNLLQGLRRRAQRARACRSERVVERVHGGGRQLVVNDALADELVGGHVREVEVELERAEGGEWGEGFGEVLLREIRG